MEDRVGEILARRARIESGAGPAVAIGLAVGVHAAIAAAIAWAAWHAPAPQIGNILTIKFQSSGADIRPAAPPAAAKPRPQKIDKVEVPQVPVTRPAPAPPKVEPKVVPLALDGKSTKKGSEHAVPTPVAAPPPGKPAAATSTAAGGGIITAGNDVAIGSTGVTGLDGDFRDLAWVERMKILIGGHWGRPTVTGATTVISFVIERDGRIRDAAIERPSGNGTFDRAALRAVLESSPLPPLPFTYNGTYLGIHLTFR